MTYHQKKRIMTDIGKAYGINSYCYKLYNIEPEKDIFHMLVGCDPSVSVVSIDDNKIITAIGIGTTLVGQVNYALKIKNRAIFRLLDTEMKAETFKRLKHNHIRPEDAGIKLYNLTSDS